MINPKNYSALNNIGVCSFINNEKKSDVRSSFLEAMCLDPFQTAAYSNYLEAFTTVDERKQGLEELQEKI